MQTLRVLQEKITLHFIDFYETTYVRSYICTDITTLSLGVNLIIKYARTYSNSRDGHERNGNQIVHASNTPLKSYTGEKLTEMHC